MSVHLGIRCDFALPGRTGEGGGQRSDREVSDFVDVSLRAKLESVYRS